MQLRIGLKSLVTVYGGFSHPPSATNANQRERKGNRKEKKGKKGKEREGEEGRGENVL